MLTAVLRFAVALTLKYALKSMPIQTIANITEYVIIYSQLYLPYQYQRA